MRVIRKGKAEENLYSVVGPCSIRGRHEFDIGEPSKRIYGEFVKKMAYVDGLINLMETESKAATSAGYIFLHRM